MPEVGGVGGRGTPAQNQSQPANRAAEAAGQAQEPVGQPGALGQPTGIPVPVPPGQSAQVLPDALAGRDPSQVLAAEQLRASGGASAVEQLLGLDLRPTIMGAFAPPPGNSEALRHMTPVMRRTIMSTLLDKQRARMRRLARLVRDGGERGGGRGRGGHNEPDSDSDGSFTEALVLFAPDEAQLTRARSELMCAARLLDLLNELLNMQDYTISQMGTSSKG